MNVKIRRRLRNCKRRIQWRSSAGGPGSRATHVSGEGTICPFDVVAMRVATKSRACRSDTAVDVNDARNAVAIATPAPTTGYRWFDRLRAG